MLPRWRTSRTHIISLYVLIALGLSAAHAQHCINSYCEELMDCGNGCNVCCHDPPGSLGFCAADPQDCSPSPPTPSAHWPVFQDQKSLIADPWGQYYKQVYGEIPAEGSFPLHIGANWLFYNYAIDVSKVTNIPKSVGDCPTSSAEIGQRYAKNNIYSPNDVTWAWHPYPYAAVKANTWVEVMHEADPFGDEHHGVWFIYTPGSGIYFNLGKTIAFQEHYEAFEYFHVGGNEDMCQTAAAAGYDSIQFLAHVDHVNYPCDSQNTGRPGFNYMGVEIVGTKLVGTFACTSTVGAPSTVKAGWQASRPCTCDNARKFLNCNGVPTISDDGVSYSVHRDENTSAVLV